MTIAIPSDYYTMLSNVESNNNPLAKSPTSSASGLYQFTKSTWQSLGQDWSNVFNVGAQSSAIQTLTQQNAQALVNAGLDVNNQNLYAAHFLGAGTAIKALTSPNNTDLESVIGSNAIAANNSAIGGDTVGDFKNWLAQKTTGLNVGQSSGTGSNIVNGAASTISGGANTITSGLSSASNALSTAVGDITTIGGELATGNVLGAAGSAIGDVLGVFGIGGSSSKSSASNPFTQLIAWIENLFSAHTAARFAFVVIGILLVGVAVMYLAANSDTGQAVIANAGKVAAVAA